jgi:hypothetical protein
LFKWPVVKTDDSGLVVAAGWVVGSMENAPSFTGQTAAKGGVQAMAATVAVVKLIESLGRRGDG